MFVDKAIYAKARHTAAMRKNIKASNNGLGKWRITFQTTMLIDSILRGGGIRE
jgi:hypothetical protein